MNLAAHHEVATNCPELMEIERVDRPVAQVLPTEPLDAANTGTHSNESNDSCHTVSAAHGTPHYVFSFLGTPITDNDSTDDGPAGGPG